MGHTAPLWITTGLVAIHSALFGAALCCLGPFLNEGFHGAIHHDIQGGLSNLEQSAATALLLLACVPGSFLTGPAVDQWGNRVVLIANGLLWLIGGVIMLFSNVTTILIGRFVLGLAVGTASVVPPMLLNQIEPSDLKGTIANMHQISICAAQLAVYILSVIFVSVDHGWKYLNAGLFVLFGVITFVSGFFIIESPLWLLKNDQEGQALSMLRLLRQGNLADFWKRSKSDLTDFANDPGAAIKSLRLKNKHTNNTFNSENNIDDNNDEAIVATHQVFYGEDEQPSAPPAPSQYNQQQSNNGYGYDNNYDSTPNPISPVSGAGNGGNGQGNSPKDFRTSLPQGQSNLQEIEVNMSADDPVYVELEKMKNTLAANPGEVSWKDLLRPEYQLQLLLCFGMMTLQPLSGINGVVMFATRLFGWSGLSDTGAIWGTVLLGTLAFIATMASSLLLDKLGRKLLITIGAIACAVFLFLLSATLLLLDGFAIQGSLALILTNAYVVAFQPLGGPIWVSLGEYTSSSIKSKATPLYCVINWSLNFLLVFVTLPMMTVFGGGETDEQLRAGAGWLFIVFGAICVLGAVFAIYCLIETAGKTEDEVQTELGARGGVEMNDDTPMKSGGDSEDSNIDY